jgi:hypothetical protein
MTEKVKIPAVLGIRIRTFLSDPEILTGSGSDLLKRFSANQKKYGNFFTSTFSALQLFSYK